MNNANQTNTTPSTPASNPTQAPRRGWRAAVWATAGVLVLSTGLAACGHNRHSGWGDKDMAGPERVTKAVDKVFSRVDATDEQKTRITTIANEALAQLRPMRAEMKQARMAALDLLAAPTIDRDGIETLRAAQMAQGDAASRIVATALADIAEVLTPEQREQARAKMAKRMARHQDKHDS